MPTSTFDDGSPRHDHFHDPVTGEICWARDDATASSVRRCPACQHEHPVGTTCLMCPACQAPDLTAIAEEVFADLLPGGAESVAARARHDERVRLYGRCDMRCGVPFCRGTPVDEDALARFLAGVDDDGD
jgi:hypothetical protein